MSGQLTDYGADRAVDAGLGENTAAEAAIFIMLLTALPGAPDTNTLAQFAATEIVTAGYARQVVAWNAAAGSPPAKTNNGNINFGPFGADPPSVACCALTNAAAGVGGSVLAYWTFDVARDAALGDTLRITDTELSLDVD